MHITFLDTIPQIIVAAGFAIALVLTALTKFLPVWRRGRKRKK